MEAIKPSTVWWVECRQRWMGQWVPFQLPPPPFPFNLTQPMYGLHQCLIVKKKVMRINDM